MHVGIGAQRTRHVGAMCAAVCRRRLFMVMTMAGTTDAHSFIPALRMHRLVLGRNSNCRRLGYPSLQAKSWSHATYQ
eukprot:1781802-Pyramimonas_sp.AAC.1